MMTKACLGEELVNFGKELFVHVRNLTRKSVFVKTRRNVRARNAFAC